MTDEQIKQNAEEYANTFQNMCGFYERENCIKDFIAGAHSRDEEIGRMNTTIRLYANQISQLRKEIEQLCNPWISVEERLPVPHTPVYAKNDKRTWFFALRPDKREKPWYDIVGRHPEEVTHWKQIPEL